MSTGVITDSEKIVPVEERSKMARSSESTGPCWKGAVVYMHGLRLPSK